MSLLHMRFNLRADSSPSPQVSYILFNSVDAIAES